MLSVSCFSEELLQTHLFLLTKILLTSKWIPLVGFKSQEYHIVRVTLTLMGCQVNKWELRSWPRRYGPNSMNILCFEGCQTLTICMVGSLLSTYSLKLWNTSVIEIIICVHFADPQKRQLSGISDETIAAIAFLGNWQEIDTSLHHSPLNLPRIKLSVLITFSVFLLGQNCKNTFQIKKHYIVL